MKRLLSSLLLVVLITIALPLPAHAWDPFGTGVCDKGNTNTSAVCNDSTVGGNQTNPISGPDGIILKATHLVALLAGIIAVILIIVGGIRYALANGDANNIKSARNTVIYSLVGLAVIVLANTLITFIVDRI